MNESDENALRDICIYCLGQQTEQCSDYRKIIHLFETLGYTRRISEPIQFESFFQRGQGKGFCFEIRFSPSFLYEAWSNHLGFDDGVFLLDDVSWVWTVPHVGQANINSDNTVENLLHSVIEIDDDTRELLTEKVIHALRAH